MTGTALALKSPNPILEDGGHKANKLKDKEREAFKLISGGHFLDMEKLSGKTHGALVP
jgi:hypothetical protein